jgi:hypothetical protein
MQNGYSGGQTRRFLPTAQLRNTCTIFNHVEMAGKYYYLGCIFACARQP